MDLFCWFHREFRWSHDKTDNCDYYTRQGKKGENNASG